MTSSTQNAQRPSRLVAKRLADTSTKAFTLFEVVLVIGLAAFILAIALPNFNMVTGNEVASRLGQFAEDVRSAYDYSVLTGKPLRLVIQLQSGEYWLEASDSTDIKLGNELVVADPLPEVEEETHAYFDQDFENYTELLGEPVQALDDDEQLIPVETPVTKAKEALRPPMWRPLETMEWGQRSFGDYLIVRDVQATHHERPVTLDEGPQTIAMIYFLPWGYVERTVLHVFYRDDTGQADTEREPYTIEIFPYEGYADVRSGYEEIDVLSEKSDAA